MEAPTSNRTIHELFFLSVKSKLHRELGAQYDDSLAEAQDRYNRYMVHIRLMGDFDSLYIMWTDKGTR